MNGGSKPRLFPPKKYTLPSSLLPLNNTAQLLEGRRLDNSPSSGRTGLWRSWGRTWSRRGGPMRPAPGPQPQPAAGDTSPAGRLSARKKNHVTEVKQFLNYLPNNLAKANSM